MAWMVEREGGLSRAAMNVDEQREGESSWT